MNYMASHSVEQIGAFKKAFTDLTGYLCEKFPDDTDIKRLSRDLDIGLSAGARIILEHFVTHVVVTYMEQILSQDEDFFLKKESHEYHADEDIIDKVKDLWEGLKDRPKIKKNILTLIKNLIYRSVEASSNQEVKRRLADFLQSEKDS